MVDVDKNRPGIYGILNTINKKFYIGSASIFRKRFDHHRTLLNRNIHSNKHLQSAWNKYGAENFTFHILEYVDDKTKLEEREQYYLDNTKCFQSHIGYNLSPNAKNNTGIKFTKEHKLKLKISNTGQKRSAETKRKIGLSKKGTTISEERKIARRNYRHTEEAKLKISARKGWKHSEKAKSLMSFNRRQAVFKVSDVIGTF